ncbi:hypothetical protein Tcan_00293 [Toxocara canis]|uniref:Reverse transcriptase domain-containing protein n=1 Tax=Toxocara canis TaxID=6265 RepID=A0A0B2USL1_TOXCA|nr:hypothetical protein Tcan_00293 [Toxocara canis]
MMDHIFTLTQLLGRAREYKLLLCVAFVDYEKAFDSVEINAVLNSLHNQSIAAQYINLLKEANAYCTTDIKLLSAPVTVPAWRRVSNRETQSPRNCSLHVSNQPSETSTGKVVPISAESISTIFGLQTTSYSSLQPLTNYRPY